MKKNPDASVEATGFFFSPVIARNEAIRANDKKVSFYFVLQQV